MPEDVKVPHVARVIGIDPSTTNMGVFIVDVNLAERAPFDLVYANTIYGDKVVYDVPAQFDDTAGTGIMARIYCMARALRNLINIFRPTEDQEKTMIMVGNCEDNFLGISALTFKQLVMCMTELRNAFYEAGIHLSFVLPNLAKAIVGANFRGTQKEDVKKGLLAYAHLDHGDVDLNEADEHTVDAGAVTLFRAECIAKDYGVWHEQT